MFDNIRILFSKHKFKTTVTNADIKQNNQTRSRASTRVYEYAKSNNLSSKEVIILAKSVGYTLNNHMSVLEPQVISALNEYLASLAKQSQRTQSYYGQVRVYQYAKSARMSSKEIIRIIRMLGFEVNNHMSPVDERVVKALDDFFKQSTFVLMKDFQIEDEPKTSELDKGNKKILYEIDGCKINIEENVTLALDTNVLFNYPGLVDLVSNDIIIAKTVLREIDKKKNHMTMGKVSRDISRSLEERQLRGSLQIVNHNKEFMKQHDLDFMESDDKIIAAYLEYSTTKINDNDILFITFDRNARITARNLRMRVFEG